MKTTITINKNIEVSNEDIDDIMATALEGGINYWCGLVSVKQQDFKGAEYASDALSKGATLILFDAETNLSQWELTREKLLIGITKYFELPNSEDILDENGTLDTCMIDSCVSDSIIQLALFGELIFG